MDIEILVKVTARAWSLPILALLHDGVPGRQAPLLARTSAGRTAFGQSMDNLIALKLVEHAPGHGHPLRPEFRLTLQGKPVAAMAARISKAMPTSDAPAVLRRSWTVPVLAVSQQPRYFSAIKTTLPNITDRALSQSLKQLRECDWIRRDVNVEHHPPRALYRAVNDGALIAHAVMGTAA